MKKEYDFSKGERGRFYRAGVELEMRASRREGAGGQNGTARGLEPRKRQLPQVSQAF
jgi:hypothetical protein